MPSKTHLILQALALGLPLACSGGSLDPASGGSGGVAGMGAAPSDDLHFVPEGLPNSPRDGDVAGGLTLVAFSLLQGETGPELYAAVRNDGPAPSCEAGMLTDFFDESGQLVASAGSVLQTRQFYRTDSGVIIPCFDPGEIAMSVSSHLPESIVITELGALKHAFPAFTVDGIVPVAGLGISAVQVLAAGAGSAYTGTFSNGLDVSVSAAQVTIFPVNRVGRPLSAATSSAPSDLPARGSWQFETSTVPVRGVDYAAYPAASISN